MKTIAILVLAACTSACSTNFSNLTQTQKVTAGALTVAAVTEATDDHNLGSAHLAGAMGLTLGGEAVAEAMFPDNELMADLFTIGSAGIPAYLHTKREKGNSLDSDMDYVLPLGNFLYTICRRLTVDNQTCPLLP